MKTSVTISQSPRKIVLSGGGTGGSVRPLLALAEVLHDRQPDWELVFIGTKTGPERQMIAELTWSLNFVSLPSGKWRRYFSIYNFLDIFKIIKATWLSWRYLGHQSTDLIISAGSFASVPLVWAANLRQIPILIHQQDIRPGLANRLMAPMARVITVTFEKSLLDYGPRAICLGNPISLTDIQEAQASVAATKQQYHLHSDQPIVLVIGGGTGAVAINQLVQQAQKPLAAICQIVHLTGRGKLSGLSTNDHYQIFDFLNNLEVLKLMAAADLVVSRAGLGTLSELAALAKPAILIPMPNSHQEDNATLFQQAQAAVVVQQANLRATDLVAKIQEALYDQVVLDKLSMNIVKIMKRGSAAAMATIVQEIVQK